MPDEQRIIPAGEDFDYIAKRWKEIKEEREKIIKGEEEKPTTSALEDDAFAYCY